MAKYLTITKIQVMAMRNTLLPLASQRRGSIKREQLLFAMQKAGVPETPDQHVLNLLFRMWDLRGTGRVACSEFIVAISVLACKDDTVENATRFALQVADRDRTGVISSRDASAFLRGA
jgi:Ca2+-binding EF-hand superfamily protein